MTGKAKEEILIDLGKVVIKVKYQDWDDCYLVDFYRESGFIKVNKEKIEGLIKKLKEMIE